VTECIRILLVDDQPLLRRGFRMILEAEPGFEVVSEADDGERAVVLSAALQPDVVLMDVRMPGMDGLAATRAIVAADNQVRVLILTTFDVDEYVFAGLRAGASGFLLKDIPPSQLVEAIRTVARGDAIIAPSATRRLIDRYAARLPDPAGDRKRAAALEPLTERELEVLGMIATGRSNREIAQDLYLSEGTVKVHVGHVLAKLGLRDRVQAVVLAYEIGLIAPGAGLVGD
jgi:DNA-binding NarL/FixJ family response regulator